MREFLVIFSLICQLEDAALPLELAWLGISVPLPAILIPAGFFLSVTFTPDAGVLVLAFSVALLGVGLVRAQNSRFTEGTMRRYVGQKLVDGPRFSRLSSIFPPQITHL